MYFQRPSWGRTWVAVKISWSESGPSTAERVLSASGARWAGVRDSSSALVSVSMPTRLTKTTKRRRALVEFWEFRGLDIFTVALPALYGTLLFASEVGRFTRQRPIKAARPSLLIHRLEDAAACRNS